MSKHVYEPTDYNMIKPGKLPGATTVVVIISIFAALFSAREVRSQSYPRPGLTERFSMKADGSQTLDSTIFGPGVLEFSNTIFNASTL